MLVNSFVITGFITVIVVVFGCYLIFGHVLLGFSERHQIALPDWIRTITVTTQFTVVYFAPRLANVNNIGNNNVGNNAVGVAGDGAGGNNGAGGGENIAASERERIIAQFGTQVLNVPPREEGGGGGDVAAAAAAPPAAAPPPAGGE